MQTFRDIKIDHNNGQLRLSLVNTDGQTITGEISLEQLIHLNGEIEAILDPQKNIKERLKDLKRFKREAFTHYRQERDPKLKQERWNFYDQLKKLVIELEEGITNGS